MTDSKIKAFNLLHAHNIPSSSILCLAEVGSTALGISVGNDDIDYMVIRMESWEEFVTSPNDKSLFIRTQVGNQRSTPGDIDIQVHTLRRFTGLLKSANPSILIGAFSTKTQYLNRDIAYVLLPTLLKQARSKRAFASFMGYMTSQRKRLDGSLANNVNRPELVSKYGFDTKYAGHLIRLGIQGKEYLSTGNISCPMRQSDIDLIVNIRNGNVPKEDVLKMADKLQEEIRILEIGSNWSELPNEYGIQKTLSQFYWNWYEEHGMTQGQPAYEGESYGVQ